MILMCRLLGINIHQGKKMAVQYLLFYQKKKISDAQCGFGLSPHVSHTKNVVLEEVKVEIKLLDKNSTALELARCDNGQI